MQTGEIDAIAEVIEGEARKLYEEGRKHVSGRPKWEDLNPQDPYDMGMRSRAISQATEKVMFNLHGAN